MQVEQTRWSASKGWEPSPASLGDRADLVFVFAGSGAIHDASALEELARAHPKAQLFGCTTSGEICGTQVFDEALVATAVHFEHTRIASAYISIADSKDSRCAGKSLARSISHEGLAHAFVLSDGLKINGSELVRGLAEDLPESVLVTGGLSGDGERFRETFVLCDQKPRSGAIAILGFYGDRLRVGCGSMGGWDPFGPERLVTKASSNELFELDGKSALELYKRYLGEHAKGLPATGLLFPLAIRSGEGDQSVVRTILSVNEDKQSLIFAGDVPEGWYARLMKANFDRLIDGAIGAAKTSYQAIDSMAPDLALLISCVGRKMVLKQRIEEEVEGVQEVLGGRPVLAGFYSYGEISPFTPSARCELHNQTMTITTLSERE
jgi:hypothetical protein